MVSRIPKRDERAWKCGYSRDVRSVLSFTSARPTPQPCVSSSVWGIREMAFLSLYSTILAHPLQCLRRKIKAKTS